MDKKRLVLALMTAVIVTLPLAIFLGCEIDSAESTIADVDIIVEGYYTNPDGGNLVQQNTGNPITSLNVLQNGSSLEAVDNNGLIFRGSIGQVVDSTTASFTLEGFTTIRQAATITGNFTVPGGADTSTMRGTWAEPSLFSTVYGQASVPINPTNAPPETNDVDQVATPVISSSTGSASFTNAVTVSITTTTGGATIYYTTNNSDPTGSTLYAGSFTLTNSATVKAVAVKEDMEDSAEVSVTFTRVK